MMLTYIIVLFLGTFVQGIEYYYLLDDQVREITCNYGDTCATEDSIIEIESGYRIKVTVKSINIDGDSGDFLIIKSGTSVEDGLTGRIFTYTISEEKEYISLTENVLIHFSASENSQNTHTAFVLTAERFGEQETTVAPDVTDRPWPTPTEEDFAYLTVNLSISNIDNETLPGFQEIVAQMGREYVVTENLELVESISTENVQIQSITECPIYWPNRDSCIQITFAFPILLSEESELYGTYQLNGSHLESMWRTASNYLENTDYEVYQLPNNNRVILIWMSVVGSTMLLFGIFYLTSGYECSAYVLRKKKHDQEQNEKLTSEHERHSVNSLPPHPFQSMPPLFDNDISAFYDPDSPPSPPVILRSPGRSDNHDDARDTLELEFRHFSFNAQALDKATNA